LRRRFLFLGFEFVSDFEFRICLQGMATTRWIIGLAPGSSFNGVDAALLEVQGTGLDVSARPAHLLHQPYARDLRQLLMQVTTGAAEARQFSLLHRLLGETFAAAALQLADRARFSLPQALCIGCPGQCIWHETEGRFPSALDLGMSAVVAERTGITTLSDFQARDLAAAGQGVLLEALADFLLFRHASETRLLIHLGGMATAVWLPAGGRAASVVGFEAGPCNLLLDALIRQLTAGKELVDSGGKHAVQGRCVEAALERWLEHPYWQRRPPRSLTPRPFTEEFVAQACQIAKQSHGSLHDWMCTATHLVARGLMASIRRFQPAGVAPVRVLLSGGGVRNGLLWHLLEQQLAGLPVDRTDAVGIPAESRKAIACGVMACLTIDQVPASLPAVTGAAGARMLGNFTPGTPGNWARCMAWMANQGTPTVARAS
jgi:anhydro-N-acetylmuramic acid kinase